MSAHTPGPWKAHATGLARGGVPEFEIHWSDIGECVAEIVHGEDDARLIAAAPDLLAALQSMLADAECFAKHLRNSRCVEDARAAIAKATGSPA